MPTRKREEFKKLITTCIYTSLMRYLDNPLEADDKKIREVAYDIVSGLDQNRDFLVLTEEYPEEY